MAATPHLQVDTVDVAAFLKDPTCDEALEACKKVAEAFKATGVLIVRDPRVNEDDNNSFLDLMEEYFSQDYEAKVPDMRPDIFYQVGVTPDHTEVPRCAADPACGPFIESLAPENKPMLPLAADIKWRFFWRVGDRPTQTKFAELNVDPVVPKGFPTFEPVMNRWGRLMHASVLTAAEMLAVGLGLERDTFSKRAHLGPHLLAPTGSDLNTYHKKGEIFAGFHYDLNFLTIHGKSRYPGLYVWKRDGSRLPVKVPDGCLIIQAGKQLEWLTGDAIRAGYHEVIVDDNTIAAMERQRAAGRPLWRVSSTFFLHVASDEILEPLPPFRNEETLKQYPPTFAGDYVTKELEYIQLAKR